jgi:manganese/iron transport system ATP-binding protein/manganese/zinc/iron transport system ATP- binding protein
MTDLVRTRDLRGGYAPGSEAIAGVTFTAAAGERIAVLGPNGGGKTTLFRALLGELAWVAGEAEVAGRPAHVAQTDRTRLDFPVSALDVALMGEYGRTPWYRRLDRRAATAALERVGLAGEAGTRFGELSGGQRQRVLLARALLEDASVLLLDEPLSAVDAASAAQIERLFGELRDEGRTLLIATHDVRLALAYDRVLCLHGRQVAFGAPRATLTADVLQATYGHELVMLDASRGVAVDHHEHPGEHEH